MLNYHPVPPLLCPSRICLQEQIDGASYDPRNREWNRQLVHAVAEWQSQDLTVYVNNLDAVDMESERILDKDQRLLWLSYAMVLVYCHVALFKKSWSQCKSHLAIISCLSGTLTSDTCSDLGSGDGDLFSLWSGSALWRQGVPSLERHEAVAVVQSCSQSAAVSVDGSRGG